MLAILYFAVVMAGGVQVYGFHQCLNPTENGTTYSTDDLCIWLCTDLLCTPNPSQTADGDLSTHSPGTTRHTPIIDQSTGTPQDRCRNSCQGRLKKADRCDSEALLRLLVELCPNAPLLQVCLTSCGCCALNPPPANCMGTCIEKHGRLQVVGSLGNLPQTVIGKGLLSIIGTGLNSTLAGLGSGVPGVPGVPGGNQGQPETVPQLPGGAGALPNVPGGNQGEPGSAGLGQPENQDGGSPVEQGQVQGSNDGMLGGAGGPLDGLPAPL